MEFIFYQLLFKGLSGLFFFWLQINTQVLILIHAVHCVEIQENYSIKERIEEAVSISLFNDQRIYKVRQIPFFLENALKKHPEYFLNFFFFI